MSTSCNWYGLFNGVINTLQSEYSSDYAADGIKFNLDDRDSNYKPSEGETITISNKRGETRYVTVPNINSVYTLNQARHHVEDAAVALSPLAAKDKDTYRISIPFETGSCPSLSDVMPRKR